MSEFPIEALRERFPALSRAEGGGVQVFLDNPAGTQLPQTVIDAVGEAMVAGSSNLGGFFPSSVRADEIWRDSHTAMADMLGATSMREVMIGPSMTALTLHMSRSIGRTLEAGDEIIVTRMDHEGDVSPWLHMARDRGLVVKWLPFNRDSWQIELEELDAILTDKTRLLALNYASNLTGSVNRVADLAARARGAGALVYVDAVQLAPHRLVDVETLNCDFLACSSYKFYGPHLGVLWGRASVLEGLAPYKVRCGSDELPESFESGTPQTELLAGLLATVEHFQWLGQVCGFTGSNRALIAGGYTAQAAHEDVLTAYLIEGLTAIPGLTIHGITNPNRFHERVPTVSFTHKDVLPSEIAKALADRRICVWSGHNYAYEVVKHLGLDESHGVLRIGLAQYNTQKEVAHCVQVLSEVLS